jgi:DNA-binding transcriptional LysR family regulator
MIPGDVQWRVVLGPGHPAWKRPIMTEARWLQSTHLQLVPHGSTNTPSALDELLAQRGLSRVVKVQLSYLAAVPEILAAGKTIITVPAPAAAWLCSRHALRSQPLPPALGLPPLRLRMTWHAARQQDRAHRWLREVLRETLSKLIQV